MAVPNRGRGLSQAVFQAPNLIGQAQQQQQLRQRDRALDLQEQSLQAKQRAANKKDPYKLQNGDIAEFGTLFQELGTEANNAIMRVIENNPQQLAEEQEMGYGPNINKLKRFQREVKALSEVANEYEKMYLKDGDGKGVSRSKYAEYVPTIKQIMANSEVVMDEDGSAKIRMQDGSVLGVDEFITEYNPKSYYREPITYQTGFLDVGTSGITPDNIDSKARNAAYNAQEAYNLGDKVPFVRMVERYFTDELGYSQDDIPPYVASKIAANQPIEELGITPKGVLDWNTQYWKKHNLRKFRESGGDDKTYTPRSFVRTANITPFSEEALGVVQNPIPEMGVMNPNAKLMQVDGISIPKNRRAEVKIGIETDEKDENGNNVKKTYEGDIESIYKNPNGDYVGVVWVNRAGVYGKKTLTQNDLNMVKQELRLPNNISLDEVIEIVNQGGNVEEQSRAVRQPVQQTQQVEETQQVEQTQTGEIDLGF